MRKLKKLNSLVHTGLTPEQYDVEHESYMSCSTEIPPYKRIRCFICKRRDQESSMIVEPNAEVGFIQPLEFYQIEITLGDKKLNDYWCCHECIDLIKALSGQLGQCNFRPINVED